VRGRDVEKAGDVPRADWPVRLRGDHVDRSSHQRPIPCRLPLLGRMSCSSRGLVSVTVEAVADHSHPQEEAPKPQTLTQARGFSNPKDQTGTTMARIPIWRFAGKTNFTQPSNPSDSLTDRRISCATRTRNRNAYGNTETRVGVGCSDALGRGPAAKYLKKYIGYVYTCANFACPAAVLCAQSRTSSELKRSESS
jgi:hypothetical protein